MDEVPEAELQDDRGRGTSGGGAGGGGLEKRDLDGERVGFVVVAERAGVVDLHRAAARCQVEDVECWRRVHDPLCGACSVARDHDRRASRWTRAGRAACQPNQAGSSLTLGVRGWCVRKAATWPCKSTKRVKSGPGSRRTSAPDDGRVTGTSSPSVRCSVASSCERPRVLHARAHA